MQPRDTPADSAQTRRLYDTARAAWPAVEVAFETFAARLEPGSSSHASDLYLACACAEQNSAALAAFDQMFVPIVRDAVARIDRSHDFVAEVQQILRERLLVGPHAKIREYRGGGPLASWLRTAAVRTVLNLLRRTKKEAAPAEPVEAFGTMLDPAIALLRQRHVSEIDSALRRAIAGLDPQARLLLNFYYVDGLTLAKIAALEGVGTSTIFRRMSAATQSVLAAVKQDLTDKLQLSSQSLDSLLGHVRDEIDLSLSQILRDPSAG